MKSSISKMEKEIEKNDKPLKELFGKIKFKKPISKIIKEARKDLESKWM